MTWGSFNAEEPLAWEQMDALWDAGCNFFDNAEMYPVAFNYGKTTEEWMGNWLAKRVRHCRHVSSSLVPLHCVACKQSSVLCLQEKDKPCNRCTQRQRAWLTLGWQATVDVGVATLVDVVRDGGVTGAGGGGQD